MGELAGLSRNFVGMVERAECEPALGTIISLAHALEVPIAALFEGIELPPAEDPE